MNRQRHLGRMLAAVAVMATVSACGYAAGFLLRFAGDLPRSAEAILRETLPAVVALKMGALCWFRLHRGWNRYVTFEDLVTLAKAVACASIGITLADAFVLTRVT